MATFLDTQAISNELLKLIKEAKQTLILISPYLKTSETIRDRIVTKDSKGTLKEFLIIYGKDELSEKENLWINGVKGISLLEKMNLHAKAYISEDRAIICSMNMHSYSQQYNIEMGILITRKDDKLAYNSLIEEVNNIKLNGTWKKKAEKESNVNGTLTNLQRLNRQVLILWRNKESLESKLPISKILTDNEIEKLTNCLSINEQEIEKFLPRIKFEKYAYSILKELYRYDKYYLGFVKDVKEKNESQDYDRVLLSLDADTDVWFDTANKELPDVCKNVAVSLNKNWVNYYFYLD